MIIGLTGKNGAGKGEVAKFLKERGLDCLSLSDVLREELAKRRKSVTRDNLVGLGNELRKKFGPGVLAQKTLEKVEFIATPTTPTTAFKLGEKLDDPVAMYLCDIFSAPANLSGVPSIAVPSGETPSGLPLSVQFMAPHFAEDALFKVAKDLEAVVI